MWDEVASQGQAACPARLVNWEGGLRVCVCVACHTPSRFTQTLWVCLGGRHTVPGIPRCPARMDDAGAAAVTMQAPLG